MILQLKEQNSATTHELGEEPGPQRRPRPEETPALADPDFGLLRP